MVSSVLLEPPCTLLKSAAGFDAGASVLLEPPCTLEKSAFRPPLLLGASDSESGSLGFLGLLIGASCAAFCGRQRPTEAVKKTSCRAQACIRRSLPRVAHRAGRGRARQHAPGVDVEAAAARVARLHRQRFGPAAGQHVDEDAFDALFMEPGVLAER